MTRVGFIGYLFTVALLCSCSFSTRPVDPKGDLLAAEKATTKFHELLNQQELDALYAMMDKSSDAAKSRRHFDSDIRATFDTLGKSLESLKIEQQIFQNPNREFTSQVRLAYETKFEKGNGIEIFTWNVKNGEAFLFDHVIKRQ